MKPRRPQRNTLSHLRLDMLKNIYGFYKCINFACVIGDACRVDLNINHEAHEVHEVFLNDLKNKII